jgi:hypothetical protein
MSGELLRPSDWAKLVLASGDCLPRQRARDQQADLAGAEMRLQVLKGIVELDPDPPALEAALHKIVHELDAPSGPLRAIAVSLRDDFQATATTPELLAWLKAGASDEA